ISMKSQPHTALPARTVLFARTVDIPAEKLYHHEKVSKMHTPRFERKEPTVSMRHRCVLVFLLVAWSAAAATAGEVSFGVKGGLVTSNVTGIPEEWENVQSYLNNFCGGVFLNYAFDEALSIQPEILYVPKGVKGVLYDGFIDVDVTPSIDFIEIPLLLKYTFPAGGAIRPCIFAGPSVGFVIDSQLEIGAGWLSSKIDMSDFTNDTDFSIVAGAGIGYETRYGLLTFDARFQRGFSNIIESAEFDVFGSTQSITIDEFKHYAFLFLAGMQF
ncbi:MAG TPA: PorT family protein, partial [Candidatus Eisenbacteria bacterium]|nr:PorT family protein [Candidatus Eisenbacteria bacterium]